MALLPDIVADMPPVIQLRQHAPRVAEFFAGVGLARLGMERAGLRVVWANDVEPFKAAMYSGHFGEGAHELVVRDVGEIRGSEVPDIDVAWASFPCTDLSLAGNRAGLDGMHSSTFFEFTRVLEEMGCRRPSVVVLENVTALANSHGGADLAAAVRELNDLGYSVDVLTLDARRFVPQSRPRLFLVAASFPPDEASEHRPDLRPEWLSWVFQDPTLRTHQAELPQLPPMLTQGLGDVVERMHARDPRWWDKSRTDAFLTSLSVGQADRLERLRTAGEVSYRTAYRRTRGGRPVWEIRPDDVSGCLRTARGGSSKQAVVRAGKGRVAVRWMTPLEYARLMGAGEYVLEGVRDSQALFGFGDAVSVDVVAWLSREYLLPLVKATSRDLRIDHKEVRDGQSRSRVV